MTSAPYPTAPHRLARPMRRRDCGAASTGLIIGVVTVGAAGLITLGAWAIGGSDGDDANADSATTSILVSTTEESTTTSSSTSTSTSTSTTTTTTSTTAPPPPPAPAPAPAPSGGGGGEGTADGSCTTASISSINNVRAQAGAAALGTMGNGTACSWAKQLAKMGYLDHGNTQCGYQVVGYVGRSAPGGESSAPGNIINNWFNSPPHYTVLTHPTPTKIALAFYLVTNADGSWRMYGVGNLC